MSNTNTFQKKIWLILAGIVACSLFVMLAPKVYADVNSDAEKFCQKGRTPSSQQWKACVHGYTEKFKERNNKASVICKKYSVKANKKACLDGAKEGNAAAKRETKAEKNKTVTLKDGTNPNFQCGDGKDEVNLRIDLGCQGVAYEGPGGAIGDMLFSIIRFLSIGVGIVVVGAIIVSGIQYTTGEGNPEATQNAKNRIQASIISLVIYVFIFSIAQFLIPGGFFT